VPSVLRAPRLQDEPCVPARLGDRRNTLPSEGGPLVGGSPPPSPPLLRRASRCPFTSPARLLVGAHRLDPRARLPGYGCRCDSGLRALSRARVDQPPLPRPALGLRGPPLCRRRVVGPPLGVLRVHDALVAWHVPRQLALPPLRSAAL